MSQVEINVRHNGPYKVTGPMTLIDAQGREFELPGGTATALCRCGYSGNKPFCDKSHKRIGFYAEDPAPRVSA
jgi:CDGSH-type Zn-finger protein